MSDRKFIIPSFGPFAGMRVIGASSLISMPFALSMLAEFGAEVIQIERPGTGWLAYRGRMDTGGPQPPLPHPGTGPGGVT